MLECHPSTHYHMPCACILKSIQMNMYSSEIYVQFAALIHLIFYIKLAVNVNTQRNLMEHERVLAV